MPERSIILDRLGEEIGRIHGEKRSIVPLAPSRRKLPQRDPRPRRRALLQHGAVDPIGIVRAVTKNAQANAKARPPSPSSSPPISSNSIGRKTRRHPPPDRPQVLEIAIAFRIERARKRMKSSKPTSTRSTGAARSWASARPPASTSRNTRPNSPSRNPPCSPASSAGRTRSTRSTRRRPPPANATPRSTAWSSPSPSPAAEADAAKHEPINVRPNGAAYPRESYAMDAIRRDLEIILEKQNIDLGGLTSAPPSTSASNRKPKKPSTKACAKSNAPRLSPPNPRRVARTARNRPRAPTYMQGAAVVVENRTGARARRRRRPRCQRVELQPRHPRQPPARLDLQTLRLSRRFRRGPAPGHLDQRRPDPTRRNQGRRHLAARELRRQIRRHEARLLRPHPLAQHDVGPRRQLRRHPAVRKSPTSPASPPRCRTTRPPTSARGRPPRGKSPPPTRSSPTTASRYRPYLISEIRDRDGNVLYTTPPLPYPAANAGSAWSVSRILNEVTTRGTAAAVKRLGFDKPCAGKTGTTNDFKDAWFAGYTSSLTCAVWVGFDTPQNHPGRLRRHPRPAGLGRYHENRRPPRLQGRQAPQQRQSRHLELCRLSGKRATAGCRAAGTAYIDRVPADIAPPENDLCPVHPARALPSMKPPPRRHRPAQSRPCAPARRPRAPPRALPVENNRHARHAGRVIRNSALNFPTSHYLNLDMSTWRPISPPPFWKRWLPECLHGPVRLLLQLAVLGLLLVSGVRFSTSCSPCATIWTRSPACPPAPSSTTATAWKSTPRSAPAASSSPARTSRISW